MKKLKLDFQPLGAEVLTATELKKIIGGIGGSGGDGGGGGGCSVTCESGYYACCCSGDCKCHSVLDQTVYDCTDGGHGSSSCSA